MTQTDLTEDLKTLTLLGSQMSRKIGEADLSEDKKMHAWITLADGIAKTIAVFRHFEIVDVETFREWMDEESEKESKEFFLI